MVVNDHTIYSKTLEVHQNHKEKLGLMAFIAKRFCDSGFRCVAIEFGVILVGSRGRFP